MSASGGDLCYNVCSFLQATIYRDDFLAERRDREKMVDQLAQLKIKLDTETSSLRLQVGCWRGRRGGGEGGGEGEGLVH